MHIDDALEQLGVVAAAAVEALIEVVVGDAGGAARVGEGVGARAQLAHILCGGGQQQVEVGARVRHERVAGLTARVQRIVTCVKNGYILNKLC